MRKIKAHFLFFLLPFFSLVTCGIPNYFYLGSSYIDHDYNLVQRENFDYSYECTVKINDSEQVAKCKGCPSLFLFYTLASGTYVTSDGDESNLISRFGSTYNTVSSRGGLISLTENNFNQLIDTFVPSKNESLRLSLYNLSSSVRKIERPSYHISVPVDANLNPTSETIKFCISYNKQTNELMLFYDPQGEGDEAVYTKSELLLRSNGTPFSDIPMANSATEFEVLLEDNPDYRGVNFDDFQSTKIYVYAALCASSGRFDNIYWSNMFRVADPISMF